MARPALPKKHTAAENRGYLGAVVPPVPPPVAGLEVGPPQPTTLPHRNAAINNRPMIFFTGTILSRV